ncbi:MAG: hypothetical protein BA864_14085 [Desulfuromonadales bacterium C00003093]|nr:MAG: hypothetical protein BA864_14085 [Desulfuromonadales bacterium C00003093]
MNHTILKNLIILCFLIPLFLSVIQSVAQEDPGQSVQGDVFTARPAMRKVKLTGYTRARHVTDIVSEEGGRCAGVAVDIGDAVGTDGVFAVLDKTFIDLAIDKNRVDQERLKNRIAYHAKEVSRYEKLVERETAAQSTLDELRNKMDQCEFELKALKIEDVRLKERRKRHLILVQAGWIITERAVEPGEWVQAGRLLGKAGDFSTLLVPFSLSPEEFNALEKLNGAPELRFSDEGKTGVTLRASVERVSPAFDPQTRKISVDLAVNKGLFRMRGGLRAELTLELPDPSGAVLVPTSALSERYEEFWLTRADGEQVRVVLLGHSPSETSRVHSPEVKAGDIFKVSQGR